MDAGEHTKGGDTPQSKDFSTGKLLHSNHREESVSSRPSLDSQDSDPVTDADVDFISADMDGVGEGYRRRRAQWMDGLGNKRTRDQRPSKKHPRRFRNPTGTPDGERIETSYFSDDGHGSDYSSKSTSDNVELNHIASEEDVNDDEESGLTKIDRRHRERRRRKPTIEERVAGNVKVCKTERRIADRNVLKTLAFNSLLVASWYIFSLSISIVSSVGPKRVQHIDDP